MQSQSPVQIQPTLDNKPDVKENSKLVSRPVSRKIRADDVSKKIYPETSMNKNVAWQVRIRHISY